VADIEIRNVVKEFGTAQVLKGIDLSIRSGEFIVIVGPSGCGKSTLLRLIAGLEEHQQGSISIDGQDLGPLSPAERGVAMVFQSYALYPHKTVRDNIGFPLRMAGVAKAQIEARVADAARILQIEHLLDRKPGQLSGGQKQRVAIGRAIVRSPKVFLFDEPLSNLDADLRGQMRDEIVRLHKVLGTTMIYVTHDQVEAMTMADRVVVLRNGVIEQVGAPLDVYGRPANQFVASFIGSPRMNFVPCRIVARGGSNELVLADGAARAELPEGLSARLAVAALAGLRPDAVALGRGDSGTLNSQLLVSRTEPLGSRTRYSGRLADDSPFTVELPGPPVARDGDRLDFRFELDRLHFFDAKERRLDAGSAGT
jgi:ABC-type sugar transport system ATPase subunit